MYFVKDSKVREFVKTKGRRVSKEFLHHLDRMVRRKLEDACSVHNGGKKTLDILVADYVGIANVGVASLKATGPKRKAKKKDGCPSELRRLLPSW